MATPENARVDAFIQATQRIIRPDRGAMIDPRMTKRLHAIGNVIDSEVARALNEQRVMTYEDLVRCLAQADLKVTFAGNPDQKAGYRAVLDMPLMDKGNNGLIMLNHTPSGHSQIHRHLPTRGSTTEITSTFSGALTHTDRQGQTSTHTSLDLPRSSIVRSPAYYVPAVADLDWTGLTATANSLYSQCQ